MSRLLIYFLSLLFCTPLFAVKTRVPFDLLARILPENPIVLEAGGHIGQDTKWMARLWPQGTIHVFEPHPNCYRILENAVKGIPNVVLYAQALSNVMGEVSFYEDNSVHKYDLVGGASSLLRPLDSINDFYFHMDLAKVTKVSCTTVDEWARMHGISKLDFLWIDVEGNELQLFQGAKETIKQVRVVYTEVNLQKFWHGCTMYKELKDWFELQGFTEKWTDLAPNWNGNVIFVNNKFLYLLDGYEKENGDDPKELHFNQNID